MHLSTLATLILAAATAATPVVKRQTGPATDLIIRAWKGTYPHCDFNQPHLVGWMGPNEAIWGDGGAYSAFTLSRRLAANESIKFYAPSSDGGDNCGTYTTKHLEENATMGRCWHSSSVNITCIKMFGI